MYLEHFGLRELPFSLAPDPRYLYLSAQHREALAHLLYGVRSEGGFVQLTGEVGTGKTTVCRCFLEQLPEGTRAAVILNPRLTAEELLDAVCDEFEIPRGRGKATIKASLDRINGFLLDLHGKGGRAVLVVDEAQNLEPGVLEQVRLLTNLETSRHKLLQIILMGQPELRDTLARPDLRQLAQRITARFHLGALSRADTAGYVRHRLQVAGCLEELFPPEALGLLHRLSRGVPRMVNILCDRALLGAFVQGARRVDRATLLQAAREVAGEGGGPAWLTALRGRGREAGIAAAVVAAAAVAVIGWRAAQGPRGGEPLPYVGSRAPAEVRTVAPPPVQPSAPAAATATATAPVPVPSPSLTPAPSSATPPAPTMPSAASRSAVPESVAAPLQVPLPGPGRAPEPPGAPPAVPAPVATPKAAPVPAPSPPAPAGPVSAAAAQEAAFRGLFDQWGIPWRPESGNACSQALGHGLVCFRGGGGLPQLRRLDRPAVLTLSGPAGGARFALLAGFDGERALLATGGGTTAEDASALAARMTGEFTLLWRMPAAGSPVLAEGDRGPAVAWLRRQLARAAGSPPPDGAGDDVFGKETAAAVRRFQEASGIAVDGVAGPETLILLDTEPGAGTPTLRGAR